jgi:hypothetical protein
MKWAAEGVPMESEHCRQAVRRKPGYHFGIRLGDIAKGMPSMPCGSPDWQ